MQIRFARVARGFLALLAAGYWAASCSVPDFEFNQVEDAGAAGTTQNETGVGGTPGTDVPDVFDCASDLDCEPYATLPNCDVVARECVECTADNDTCQIGFFCATTHTCTPGCTT